VSRIESAQLEIPRDLQRSDLQRLGWEMGIWNFLYITMHNAQCSIISKDSNR
jgi:DMSO/TMAO reductase YedYZ heme-binding membrane subunit